MMHPRLAVAVLGLAAMLISCEKEETSSKPGTDITITANDAMQFDIKEFTVKKGARVRITLKNIGKASKIAMGHNLVLLAKGVDAMAFGLSVPAKGGSPESDWLPTDKGDILATTKLLGPGESETIEFTAPDTPGVYEYLCTFPGHVMQMRGKMIVE